MNVIINGESIDIQLTTLADLVKHYQLDEDLVVTEVNGSIVNKEERIDLKIAEGMKIEIVQFVGGG